MFNVAIGENVLLKTYFLKTQFCFTVSCVCKRCVLCVVTHIVYVLRGHLSHLALVLKGRMSRFISTRCQEVLAPLSL